MPTRPFAPRALGAVLTLAGAVGCAETTATAPTGEVLGTVVVDGSGLPGIVVELSGAGRRQAITDGSGAFGFSDVSSGAYVVTLLDVPEDASFAATAKTAVITREPGRQIETVDFVGNYIRTSAITGRITARGRPVAHVAVEIEGPDTAATTSDADGRYAVTGLRRGRYEVTISGFPDLVSFPSTHVEAQVGTGATATVDFSGDRELTATAVITMLTRLGSTGQVETVDPSDLWGRVEVHVDVDRGQDTPEAVDLYLGGERVGRQVFNIEDPGEGGDDPAPTSFQLQFTVATAAFDPDTGVPRFRNGPASLEVRLATREGGEGVWTSVVPATLRNRNTFAGRLTAEEGPVSGDDGRLWVGGDLEVEVLPVLYDEELALESALVELRRTGGATLREQPVGAEPPFRAVFEGSGDPDSGNVAGYRTPAGESDEFRVRTATFSDGSSLSAPVVIVSDVHVDNAPPPDGL